MRKLAIYCIGLMVAAAGFFGYLKLAGLKRIENPGGQVSPMDSGTPARQSRQIGETVLHTVEQSRYTILDPQTKRLKRIFGFGSLLNPGVQSSDWQVKKPYMLIFEDDFTARLDAEEGSIQVDVSGQKIVPKDAALAGRVKITLRPKDKDRFSETIILLDSLNYSSERSEFFTDGPVEVISAQARMAGKGMMLIYNPQQNGRIEYFQIQNLSYLRLKNAVASDTVDASGQPPATAVSFPADKMDILPDKKPGSVSNTDANVKPNKPVPASDSGGTSAPELLYQCLLKDQVEIRYGNQLVVQGADQIHIANIPLGQSAVAAADSKPSSTNAAAAQADKPAADPKLTAAESEPIWQESAIAITADDDQTDVLVTCNGPIVIEPMNGSFEQTMDKAAQMDIKMTGSPLKIMRRPAPQQAFEPMAICQELEYQPQQDVLKLVAGGLQPETQLYMDAGKGMLETSGPVVWQRKARQAQIDGPGQIRFESPADLKADAGKGSIRFDGIMDVLFAEPAAQSRNSLALLAVNFGGGMDAEMHNGTTLTTRADQATFEFKPDNQLSRAQLNGGVEFTSQNQTAAQSKAASDKAVLTFDQGNVLTLADFDGNVRFESPQGRFSSGKTVLEFVSNETGQLEVKSLRGSDNPVMTMVATNSRPPARFESKQIQYDMRDGAAVAEGPVRLSFYMPADSNDPNQLTPMVITAQKDARFYTGADKTIRQAVFSQNVVGDSTVVNGSQKESRRFFGDKLVVDFDSDPNGKTIVRHLAVQDGDVKLQSIRSIDSQIVNHVEMVSTRIDFDGITEVVTAGPGDIRLNNQQTPAPTPDAESTANTINLRQPCYALIEGYDGLRWALREKTIDAEGKEKAITISYLPMNNGTPGKRTWASVSKAAITLADAAGGKFQLASLATDGGVYMEREGEHILLGQRLFYASDGWVHIEGTTNNPCIVDGARVPVIDYNLQTGQLKTKLGSTPGAISIPGRK